MNSRKGTQTIGCSVKSCQYNGSSECTLPYIDVAYDPGHGSGTPEDESMCASYRKRG